MRHLRAWTLISLVLFIILTRQGELSLVEAHGALARAVPGPDETMTELPGQIVIWFTEPIEAEYSEIQVYSSEGARVDDADSRLLPGDPMALVVTVSEEARPGEGTYTVSWKNLSSVDGHLVRGSYVFSVGEPPDGPVAAPTFEAGAVPLPLEAGIRWLVLLSVAGIFGGLCFDLFVLRPAIGRLGPGVVQAAHQERLRGRVLSLVRLSIGLFLLASGGQLVIQTSNVNGAIGGASVAALATQTYWGHMWLVRVALCLLLAALMPWSARVDPARMRRQRWEHAREFAALVVCAAIMLTLSLVSHAAATTGIRLIAVANDMLHLAAAGAWTGGLLAFAWTIPYLIRQLPADNRRAMLATMTPRFSVIAALSVSVLILTGLFSSYAQVTILAALDTPYGRTLLVKLALMVPLLALGAVNLLWVGRRLATEERAGGHLGRTVRMESALAALVLLTVGILVTMEPARQQASREGAAGAETAAGGASSAVLEATSEGLTGRLSVDAALPGEKLVGLELLDRNGRPLENATDVIMTIAYPTEGLEPVVGRPANPAPGRYEFEAAPFSLAGEWHVDILVVRPDAFDTHLSYVVQVGNEGGSPAPTDQTVAPDVATARTLFGALALIAAGLIATIVIVVRRRTA